MFPTLFNCIIKSSYHYIFYFTFLNDFQELKYKLAASTHYVFYRPGRVIVKEFQKAHALYFIVSGTVTVKQQTVDPILGTVEDRVIGTMESGDLFGEVSLLQDIPRTATIETDSANKIFTTLRKRIKMNVFFLL